MDIKKAYAVYFSPTGGTKKAAEILGAGIGVDVEYIDITVDAVERTFSEDDFVIFAAPSFGGRVPDEAKKRFMLLKGHNTPACATAVYGNRAYEDTLAELKDILEDKWFVTVSAAALVAEHSIMHIYGTGRPDGCDEISIKKFADDLLEKLKTMKSPVSIDVPGNRPYKPYGVIHLAPETGKECVKCGICANECPVKAIPFDNPSITEKEKCISCMRCTKVCPESARALNKDVLSAVQNKLREVCSARKENEFFI